MCAVYQLQCTACCVLPAVRRLLYTACSVPPAACLAQSLHLWLNVLAIALSVSGARVYLDPQSPQAIPALGFVDGVLSWFSAACIPTLL